MPSELGHIKHCSTSREPWIKLSDVYESRGAARKAPLFKQLVRTRMKDGPYRKFGEILDKLNGMDVDIHKDLLSVILLYSLPPKYENFRMSVETRDESPTLEHLSIKVIEESDESSEVGLQQLHVDNRESPWCLDSGCTVSLCKDISHFRIRTCSTTDRLLLTTNGTDVTNGEGVA